ncbi:MAG: DUF4062 domain-containing protein [Fimbriimonas sp.]
MGDNEAKVTRIFISCVSSEFGSYRARIKHQFEALRGTPYGVKIQEDFRQGDHTLLEKLADYVRECDLVIHLVGDAAGEQPSETQERRLLRHLGDSDDVPLPRYSYTQWEYHLAQRFGRPMRLYRAKVDTVRDCDMPVPASPLQQAHIQRIDDDGKHYGVFVLHQDLIRRLFHDLGMDVNLKISNLPFQSLGTLFKGRDDFLAQIRTSLAAGATAITRTAATVHGLGGVGKTRTAVEYAHRYADEFTAMLFVRADSPEGLKSNLAGLCGPMVLDLKEKEATDLDVQFAAALRWLQQHPG